MKDREKPLRGLNKLKTINFGNISKYADIHLTERELTIENVKNQLKQTELKDDGSCQIVGKETTVIINGETGKIITSWKTKTKLAIKLSEVKK